MIPPILGVNKPVVWKDRDSGGDKALAHGRPDAMDHTDGAAVLVCLTVIPDPKTRTEPVALVTPTMDDDQPSPAVVAGSSQVMAAHN